MRLTNLVVLVAGCAAFLHAQIDPPGRVGRLNYMDGPVSFQPAGLTDWVDASVNRPLIPGDNIWVGDRARAELHVGSTALRLDANTDFGFLNLDDQGVQIRLSEGTLTVRVRNLPQNQVFEIDTPNVAFTILRPGEYRIDADPDSQATIIAVRDGEGDVTGGGEAFPIHARQQVTVRGDDQISYNLTGLPRADAWDQWCSTRDRREEQSQSARYVSREIPGYEDLDQYGRWGDQPGYGQVWMPTSVASGWAPYHDGHWAWIAPWGWTWVDDAPWGFAPYHYGRWASFGGRWGWIPGPYGVTPVYAPALVAWVGGGGGRSSFSLSFSIGNVAAVGWFPLGPREPYFPSYQVSQGYFSRVNTTNTVINNVTINNYYDSGRNSNNGPIANIRYANQSVPNSVTAVPQESFGRGRRVSQDARQVPSAQLNSVQVYRAPTVAPQRESVLGSRADTASRAGRPPANVSNRAVVARTAPPAAPVPFDRQQRALAQNPGRPLPTNEVQQIRQGGAPVQNRPVRVVDMGRVRRVEPPQSGASPAIDDRQKGQGRQQEQQQQQAPVNDRQNGQRGRSDNPSSAAPATTAAPPQPPVFDRGNNPRGRQQAPPQQAAPPPAAPQAPPPQADERQKGRARGQAPPQQAAPPPQAAPTLQNDDRQKGRGQQDRQAPQPQAAPTPAAPQAPAPAPPTDQRQKGRGQQERQAPQQQAVPPPQPAHEAPVNERPQRQEKGKSSREDDRQKNKEK